MPTRRQQALHTLAIIRAARPVRRDEMFPDYHEPEALSVKMIQSLSDWEEREFVASAVTEFERGCVRRGMELAQWCVHVYLGGEECGWEYL